MCVVGIWVRALIHLYFMVSVFHPTYTLYECVGVVHALNLTQPSTTATISTRPNTVSPTPLQQKHILEHIQGGDEGEGGRRGSSRGVLGNGSSSCPACHTTTRV